MRLRPTLSSLLLAAALPLATAQQPAPARPAFDAVAIKPSDPAQGGPIGFFSYPGGRVHLGSTSVQLLLYFAYDLKPFQIAGGPDWVVSDRYTVDAVPPDSSPSRQQKQSPFKIAPTEEQKQMLQTLLAERFAFKSHMETRDGLVYVLTRGTGKLLLDSPKDPDADWRGNVINKQGIYDGEAFGTNISMPALAKVLNGILGQTVVDQTGIPGTYDFHLPPVDPENHDKDAAVFDAMHRLGLNLKRGKGPIQTLVIDHIEKPSEN